MSREYGSSSNDAPRGRRTPAGTRWLIGGLAVVLAASASLSVSPSAVDAVAPFYEQLGDDLDGIVNDETAGTSVAMDGAGNTIIVGAPFRDFNDSGAIPPTTGQPPGSARIFDWTGTGWTQRGVDIVGEANDDQFGFSVAMSDDGDTVVIGSPFNDGVGGSLEQGVDSGNARIFDWNGTAWTQRGADIQGEFAGDRSGHDVAMNADGNTVIIGAPFNNGGDNGGAEDDTDGQARVYVWNGTAWTQRGTDIDGESGGDSSGWSVALSADGNTAIIGSPFNGGNGMNAGHARVFVWSGTAWTQRGGDIDGEAAGDESGISVDVSDDGSIVIVGAHLNGWTPPNQYAGPGHARVFRWNQAAWTQRGADIEGDSNDQAGWSVALSADGDTAAIGLPHNNSNGADAGVVQMVDWNGGSWRKLGSETNGGAGDFSGFSVAINNDGKVAMTGAITNNVTSGPGYARVVFNPQPTQPSAVVATAPQPRSADLTWTPGSAEPPFPITGWTIEQSSDDGASWAPAAFVTAAPTGTTITGLSDGTTYLFRVSASNTAGVSEPTVSNPVTTIAPPAAPSDVTGAAGDGQVLVSWTAPSNGGSPITQYTVTASPGGSTCTTTGALSCKVGGLTNDTAYTFTVTATNVAGTSPASAPSAQVTPVPGIGPATATARAQRQFNETQIKPPPPDPAQV